MADDRMRNDDLDRNMGGAGQQKDDFGKKTPGRNPNDNLSTGQRSGGQQGEQKHIKDDDFDRSVRPDRGQGSQGGQNR